MFELGRSPVGMRARDGHAHKLAAAQFAAHECARNTISSAPLKFGQRALGKERYRELGDTLLVWVRRVSQRGHSEYIHQRRRPHGETGALRRVHRRTRQIFTTAT